MSGDATQTSCGAGARNRPEAGATSTARHGRLLGCSIASLALAAGNRVPCLPASAFAESSHGGPHVLSAARFGTPGASEQCQRQTETGRRHRFTRIGDSSQRQGETMFNWTLRDPADSIMVAPDERLPWPHTIALGIQHVVAMFGSTVLAPLLMGFDPNIAVLMSGVGTLIFFLVVGGRVPSYLGSSFAFIAVVIAATGYGGHGPNPNIGLALGGIFVCG